MTEVPEIKTADSSDSGGEDSNGQNKPSSNARELLVGWANDQDGWVRELTRRVITSGIPLIESDVEEVYAIFLSEKRLSEVPFAQIAPLGDDLAGTDDDQVLLLKRLLDVTGVNALSSEHSIEFDDHLTVLFGQNGSGKTGYSRIIKRAANVRSHEPVLGNVRSGTPPPEPSATIEVEINGAAQTLSWKNELGLGDCCTCR